MHKKIDFDILSQTISSSIYDKLECAELSPIVDWCLIALNHISSELVQNCFNNPNTINLVQANTDKDLGFHIAIYFVYKFFSNQATFIPNFIRELGYFESVSNDKKKLGQYIINHKNNPHFIMIATAMFIPSNDQTSSPSNP